jgi:putative heme-binding domain-containing protein
MATALVALDNIPGGDLTASEIVPLLNSRDDDLRQAARWLLNRHEEWGGELVEWFRDEMSRLPPEPNDESAAANELRSLLVSFASHPAVGQLLTDTLIQTGSTSAARRLTLQVIAAAKLSHSPPQWRAAVASAIDGRDPSLVPLAVAAARELPVPPKREGGLVAALVAVADSPKYAPKLRVEALATVADQLPDMSDVRFRLLLDALTAQDSVDVRSSAADAISRASLTEGQLDELCSLVGAAGPLELNQLLPPFGRVTDEQLALKLVSSLKESAALPSLRIDILRETLAKYGPSVQNALVELESLVNVDAAAQRRRIEELLPQMESGDIRRGHAVFYSSKAVCSTCHRLGAAGGTTGPDLSRIGETRTERDLLESILYPSLSFVRSYEAVLFITVDGKAINGVIRDETPDEYVVATGPDQEVRIPRDDVDEIHPSTVSIMPAGLDKQLTTQELADLVTFLKNPTGK